MSDSAEPKAVLLITEVPFWRRQKGNQQRIAALVDWLGQHYALTVLHTGYDAPPPVLPGVHDLRRVRPHRGLRRLAHALYVRLPGRLQQQLVGLLNRRGYSRDPDSFRSTGVQRASAELLRSGRFRAVIVEYLWWAYAVDDRDPDRTRSFLDTHDLFHLRTEAFARFGRVPDRTVTRAQELAALERFDHVIAIQTADLNRLVPHLGDRVLLAMHPVAASPRPAPATNSPLTLVYFASFGDLNVDAIEWFLREVWTAELAQHFRVRIRGTICASLRLPAGVEQAGVSIDGPVADPADAWRDAHAAINPVRFGSGLKIKVVEAMAHGVPVLTTSIGAEGLDASLLLTADDVDDFRGQLERLKSPELRGQLAAKGLAFVREQLTPEACFGTLRSAIDARLPSPRR
jgi:hypothetical protein